MAKWMINGYEVGGTVNSAEAITCLDKDGKLSNVQAELDDIHRIIRKTLTAGGTSVTIEHSKITTNSVLAIYTSVYGVSPSEVVVNDGSVVLTFDPQATDLEVGVRIDG